jgi:hypothetical protein
LFSQNNSHQLRNDRIDLLCLSAPLDSLNGHRAESRCAFQVSIQSFSYASFHLKIQIAYSFFCCLDWQREDEENLEACAIPKSACRLICLAYQSFRVSVDYKFSPNVFNRELIFSFFCTCAELAVVSRQKDKEYKVRYVSDKNHNIAFSIVQVPKLRQNENND